MPITSLPTSVLRMILDIHCPSIQQSSCSLLSYFATAVPYNVICNRIVLNTRPFSFQIVVSKGAAFTRKMRL